MTDGTLNFVLGWLIGTASAAWLARRHYRSLLALSGESCARQMEIVKTAEDRMGSTFEGLAVKSLRAAKEDLFELARATFESDFATKAQTICDVVNPVRETLSILTSHVRELEKRRVGAYALLSDQVKTLAREADELSSALRRPQARGAWGELVLRQICESSGLLEGVHFVCQDQTEGADGQQLRPDMVFKLPNDRAVIVDSKCPLENFRDALAAVDEPTRTAKMKLHAKSLRGHVRSLATKEYWQRYSGSPEIVVCFIPSESAMVAALEADPELLQDALTERVLIATPVTLAALVRTIAHLLREEKVHYHAKEIGDLGRKVSDALTLFASHLGKHGRHLRLATESFNDAAKSFDASLVPRAKRLAELGSDSTRDLTEVALVETAVRSLDEPHAKPTVTNFNGKTRKGRKRLNS